MRYLANCKSISIFAKINFNGRSQLPFPFLELACPFLGHAYPFLEGAYPKMEVGTFQKWNKNHCLPD